MKKLAVIIALSIGVAVVVSGQYDYFTNAYSTDNNTEIASNLLVLNNHYVLLGQRYDQGLKLNFREVDQEGSSVGPITMSLGDFQAYYTNYAEAIVETLDGNLIWAGSVISGLDGVSLGVKFDADYNPIWVVELLSDSLEFNEYQLATELESGEFLFLGTTAYNTDADQWFEYGDLLISKVSETGELLQTSNLLLYDDHFTRVNQVFELENGDLLIVGSVYQDWDQVICRVSQDLDSVLWKYRWGHESFNDWLPWGVMEVDGTLTVAYGDAFAQSEISENSSKVRPHLMRFDPEDQSVLWDIEYDHVLEWGLTHDIVKTPDNGYAIMGFAYELPITHAYGWILKTDSVGNELWFNTYHHVWPEEGDTWILDPIIRFGECP